MHEGWLTPEQMLKSSEDEWMTRNLAVMNSWKKRTAARSL